MKLNQLKIIDTLSAINQPYITIRMTQSRLDKGLIALPISLATEWFPSKNTSINVYLGNSNVIQLKNYSSYKSKTREARIGGLAQWFQETKLNDGNEIVIQFIDKENYIYRLIPESNFIKRTKELQKDFDDSKNDDDASDKILTLTKWLDLKEKEVAINEYNRLINEMDLIKRRVIEKSSSCITENAPSNIRIILEKIYKGHCQVCDFSFLKKNGKPYFEIHHINPSIGHHLKNIVLVCANCHRQFTYANVRHIFHNNGWLTQVIFNDKQYSLNQVILEMPQRKILKKIIV